MVARSVEWMAAENDRAGVEGMRKGEERGRRQGSGGKLRLEKGEVRREVRRDTARGAR